MLKFNEYSIERVKLTYKYQLYNAQTFFLFFLLNFTDYQCKVCHWVISDSTDLESIRAAFLICTNLFCANKLSITFLDIYIYAHLTHDPLVALIVLVSRALEKWI